MIRNFLLVLIFIFSESFIIMRDDVDDSKYIELGKKYSDIVCHFEMGEGALIDSSWIITAGHVGKDLKTLLISGKNPQVEINGEKYEIQDVFVHPQFELIINDIALVKLSTKVNSKRHAALYESKDENGKRITIAGSGDMGNGLTGPQKQDHVLRAATNRIYSVDGKWISFSFDPPDSKNVTELEGVSGPGDSGGPAFIEKGNILYVAGISSHQSGKRGTYGVTEYYTRISSYTAWIFVVIHGHKTINLSETVTSMDDKIWRQYVGTYGFRKIIYKNGNLFFQREDEPLIPMKQIDKDLFIWDDNSTKIKFQRNSIGSITGFEINRKNGEVVQVKKE